MLTTPANDRSTLVLPRIGQREHQVRYDGLRLGYHRAHCGPAAQIKSKAPNTRLKHKAAQSMQDLVNGGTACSRATGDRDSPYEPQHDQTAVACFPHVSEQHLHLLGCFTKDRHAHGHAK